MHRSSFSSAADPQVGQSMAKEKSRTRINMSPLNGKSYYNPIYIRQRLSFPNAVNLPSCYLGAHQSARFFFRDTDEQCRVYGGWREEEPTCYIELNVVGGLLESFLEPQHYPGRISVLGEARFFGRLALMV